MIELKGPIDIQLLGLGRTGHIGFNEQGCVPPIRNNIMICCRSENDDAAAVKSVIPRFLSLWWKPAIKAGPADVVTEAYMVGFL